VTFPEISWIRAWQLLNLEVLGFLVFVLVLERVLR